MIWHKREGQRLRLGINWGYEKGRYITVIIVIPLWLRLPTEYEDFNSCNIVRSWKLIKGMIGFYYNGWISAEDKGSSRNFRFLFGVDSVSIGHVRIIQSRKERINKKWKIQAV